MEWLIAFGVIVALLLVVLARGFLEGYTARAPSPARQIGAAWEPPLLPSVPAAQPVTLPSFTTAGVSYHVDPAAMTCTCEDFRQTRSGFASHDIRRACKHLRQALLDADVPMADGLRDMLEDEYFPGYDLFYAQKIGSREVFFAYNRGSDWVNVFDGVDRYGYSFIERRWSYGDSPKNATAIKSVIKRLVA